MLIKNIERTCWKILKCLPVFDGQIERGEHHGLLAVLYGHVSADSRCDAVLWAAVFEKTAQEHQWPLWLSHQPLYEKPADLGLCPSSVRKALVSGGGGDAAPEPAGHAACSGPGCGGGGDLVYPGRGGAAGGDDRHDFPGGEGFETKI